MPRSASLWAVSHVAIAALPVTVAALLVAVPAIPHAVTALSITYHDVNVTAFAGSFLRVAPLWIHECARATGSGSRC